MVTKTDLHPPGWMVPIPAGTTGIIDRIREEVETGTVHEVLLEIGENSTARVITDHMGIRHINF